MSDSNQTLDYGNKTNFARYTDEMSTIDIDVGLIFRTEEGKSSFLEKLAKVPINTPIHIYNQAVPVDHESRAISEPTDMPGFISVGEDEIFTDMSSVEDVVNGMNTLPLIIVRLEYGTYKQDLIEGDFLKKGVDYQ